MTLRIQSMAGEGVWHDVVMLDETKDKKTGLIVKTMLLCHPTGEIVRGTHGEVRRLGMQQPVNGCLWMDPPEGYLPDAAMPTPDVGEVPADGDDADLPEGTAAD